MQQMPITASGIWVPNLAPKQMEVFDNFSRFLLLTGPRKSGKTLAAASKILRHCFDNDGARVAIFAKTTRNATAGGVWIDITQLALPEWLSANVGMKLVDVDANGKVTRLDGAPKITGDSRMRHFFVTNRYGSISEVQLHSLEHCPEIVDKIKGCRFSMIYFSELDAFEDRIVFDISTDQLRMLNIPFEQHQWIGDTNPPESGPNNWLHDLWFKEKDRPDHPDPEYQNSIHRIEFKLDDNPFLDPRERKELEAKYRHRQSLYNRFVLGTWEEDLTNGFFSKTFIEDLHVMGNVNMPSRADWDIIKPTPNCIELITGFDIGETNHSAHIVEKIKVSNSDYIYAVLDEIVSIGRAVSVREFTLEVMKRMAYWEKYCVDNHKRTIRWRHWSDSSAMRWRSAAEATDALIVRNVSNGRIMLSAAPKFNHSVMARVDTLQRLLHENRIYISAACPATISMVKALKRGTTKSEPISRTGNHIHVFDSLTYILFSEDPMDLALNRPTLGQGAPSRAFVI